ncbi:Rv2231c family pyridoxal phosphate-dependent protein CobC [Gephyromycinifex aptenodytis]|uniref:Rv2231c family pyridoxal phosphate-dependent protein CobC n=1 Tax=Gephyromycinifex aptenodytis TaxID=2716227 RepID=UPI001445AEA1|nr:Rv2231c family pyridoxal phosphate-dependent protein CobC [Gephyromycinifex aptenodytis]
MSSRHVPAGLLHHGDVEARGMLDFAVNVAVAAPPQFVREAMQKALGGVAAYPDPVSATEALAEHLGVAPERVLLTNGAAEAFHLIARAVPWQAPMVLHPQFTEPDSALRCAGYLPQHHILTRDNGFTLDADHLLAQVGPHTDVLFVGNPTNPTSRLHAAHDLLRLRAADRLLVVDEAFIDLVPGEQDTLLRHAARGAGVLVIRSLTKTFGLAGVRAGYLVGDPDWIQACRTVQPHWSVNHLALAAVTACASPAGVAHVHQVAQRIAAHRPVLVQGLEAAGLQVVRPPAAPFVLAHHPQAERLRLALRDKGIALRRADTFPGLGQNWLRIAVRDPACTEALMAALADCSIDDSVREDA